MGHSSKNEERKNRGVVLPRPALRPNFFARPQGAHNLVEEGESK